MIKGLVVVVLTAVDAQAEDHHEIFVVPEDDIDGLRHFITDLNLQLEKVDAEVTWRIQEIAPVYLPGRAVAVDMHMMDGASAAR